jgi:hypothetical protein
MGRKQQTKRRKTMVLIKQAKELDSKPQRWVSGSATESLYQAVKIKQAIGGQIKVRNNKWVVENV